MPEYLDRVNPLNQVGYSTLLKEFQTKPASLETSFCLDRGEGTKTN